MNTLTGTGTLARLAFRLDRVRLPVWVLVIGTMPMLTAAQYAEVYPTDADIEKVADVVTNPSLVAINGPLFAPTLGGLTTWKIMATEIIMIALMNLFTVVRHTRTEEETGRLELVGAGVVGRYAPLTAALAVAGAANAAIALVATLGLLAVGLPTLGSVVFGLTVGLGGVLFAAVAAVAAQLTTSARSAIAIGSTVLGVGYLLRALGDSGADWLSWLSPVGWAVLVRAFAAERWWVLGLIVALSAALTWAAYALCARRDIGAGLLPQRAGPAEAAPGLRSPLALAWRLHRGVLIGWLVGMAVWGLALGGVTNGIDNAFDANERLTEMLARMGGRKGLVDAYLATVYGMTGLVAAAYTVQATLRLRAEEAAGRVEPLLATRVDRLRWVASHLGFALFGTAAVLAVAGIGGGITHGLATHDLGGQVPRLLGAAMVQLPATWVLAGVGIALFGLVPRYATLAWAALIASFLVVEVGALLDLDQWVIDTAPFAHVPKLPGSTLTATPLVWLTAVAVVLVGAGLAGFRRRDLG